MKVSDILREKGAGVVTIGPHATIAMAVHELTTRRIGALVVMTDGRVEGVISEGDIVRALDRRGTGTMDLEVREVMSDAPSGD